MVDFAKIAENIRNRKAAERFVSAWLDIGRDDFRKLTPDSRKLVVRMLHDRFADKLNMPCGPETGKQLEIEKEERKNQQQQEVREALEQCERIQEMCEEVPERGAEFAFSVNDGVAEVAATIEERNAVTADQQRALDNWESGVSRWLR